MLARKVKIKPLSSVKPSVIGHYNFYYPCTREFTSIMEIKGEQLSWIGGGDWLAVKVQPQMAERFESPVAVLWGKKESLSTEE